MADAITITATAKRRRREARFDKRFKLTVSEKRSLVVKNTFLGQTPMK
jgi:hypothetical protein